MSNIFVVEDKFGKKIRLTKEGWRHIALFHPTVNDIEELKVALKYPTSVSPSIYDPDSVKGFYLYNKVKKTYLLVVVKYLNGEGFIITAHHKKKIK